MYGQRPDHNTGNSHDAFIFKCTNLWNSIQDGFLPSIGKSVGDVNVPPLIIADSAFPLHTWLMKPYTNAVFNPEQRYFNYRLSRARMVTEGTYGQFKGRWRADAAAEKRKSAQQHSHVWFYTMFVSCKQTPFQESLTYHLVLMAKREETGMKSGNSYS